MADDTSGLQEWALQEKRSCVPSSIKQNMAEALIMDCHYCKNKLFESDGCNLMTCTCGRKMCYLCRSPVNNYDHFHPEGTKPSPGRECPLFSDNVKINKEAAEKAAKEAKEEQEKDKPDVELKHDPTACIGSDKNKEEMK